MTAPLVTPLESLRRLIAEVKQLDAVEVGERWNQLQGELGVADGVVRDHRDSAPWMDTLLIEQLRMWRDLGVPGPKNELQSIQAWLSCLGHNGEKKTGEIMRKRMLLLMTAAEKLHAAGPEAEYRAGIYDERPEDRPADRTIAPQSAGSAAKDASEQISTGYAGGCAYGNEIGGHVSLHYKTGEQAEAAFTAITNMIDVAIAQGEKQ